MPERERSVEREKRERRRVKERREDDSYDEI